MREWARLEGYDYSHVCKFANGHRSSRFLVRAIDAFITEWYEPGVAA